MSSREDLKDLLVLPNRMNRPLRLLRTTVHRSKRLIDLHDSVYGMILAA